MPVIKTEDWNFKMYINGIYWKGFSAEPTSIQKELEITSFKNSDFYSNEDIVLVIRKGN
ncbi:hypothetical protein AB0Y20_01235 [Heyndrickxia oleronia]|uniref:hypothetical protein n=1 Tax=Heyndrickxia oleronia TaxID=38875 RepID=UPI003F269148